MSKGEHERGGPWHNIQVILFFLSHSDPNAIGFLFLKHFLDVIHWSSSGLQGGSISETHPGNYLFLITFGSECDFFYILTFSRTSTPLLPLFHTDTFIFLCFYYWHNIGQHRDLVTSQIQNIEKIIAQNGGHVSTEKGKLHLFLFLFSIDRLD